MYQSYDATCRQQNKVDITRWLVLDSESLTLSVPSTEAPGIHEDFLTLQKITLLIDLVYFIEPHCKHLDEHFYRILQIHTYANNLFRMIAQNY